MFWRFDIAVQNLVNFAQIVVPEVSDAIGRRSLTRVRMCGWR